MIEEKIFMKYAVSPMYLLGLEGIFCIVIHFILLVIYQFISCTPEPIGDPTWCINGKFEDSIFAIKQIGDNLWILLMMGVYVLTSSGFRITGLYLVRVASAANRITIDVSRTVLIWLFFLCVPSNWNGLRENFDYV